MFLLFLFLVVWNPWMPGPGGQQAGVQKHDSSSTGRKATQRPAPRTPPLPPECDAAEDADGLRVAEIEEIVMTAATASAGRGYSVAVVDRAGRILAVFEKPESTRENSERAIGLARAGAFFSNDQAPLSSRTVRFISQKNFPPGVDFLPNGALYGIENTNRGCSFNAAFNPGKCVPPPRSLAQLRREQSLDCPLGTPGCLPLRCDGIAQEGCAIGISTGKFTGGFQQGRLTNVPPEDFLDAFPERVFAGGIPLFKDCRVVGGVGVYGDGADRDEFIALTASAPAGEPQIGIAPCLASFGPPFAVFLDGIRLPFVKNLSPPAGLKPGPLQGAFVAIARARDGTPTTIREGRLAAEGWLIGGPEDPRGSPELAADEVDTIVLQAIAQAEKTRAAIRLPAGSRTRMVIAVADLQGNLLALYRMPDATFFSVDVAVAKARNMVYFNRSDRDLFALPTSDLGEDLFGVPIATAVTNRTISFGTQPLYPPGITGSSPGPFFDLFRNDLLHPCSQGLDNRFPLNRSGIVFFPGSVPLYKNGVLAGGLGISGDGVEQDDVVADGGSRGFEAPLELRADRIFVRGVRLPYLKFTRNPQN